MTKIYAGIGSRTTPADICELMEQLGRKLALRGAILRSGGADGADSAFERGCNKVQGKCEIYFAKHWSTCGRDYPNDDYVYSDHIWDKAAAITAQHHPSWLYLKSFTKRLHTRNCFQVLGCNLQEPADFVLCWTPDGVRTSAETSHKTGGTGQAIRVASTFGIRVYNLATPEDLELARSWVA